MMTLQMTLSDLNYTKYSIFKFWISFISLEWVKLESSELVHWLIVAVTSIRITNRREGRVTHCKILGAILPLEWVKLFSFDVEIDHGQ